MFFLDPLFHLFSFNLNNQFCAKVTISLYYTIVDLKLLESRMDRDL